MDAGAGVDAAAGVVEEPSAAGFLDSAGEAVEESDAPSEDLAALFEA